MDLTGRVLVAKQFLNLRGIEAALNLSKYAAGVYLVQIQSGIIRPYAASYGSNTTETIGRGKPHKRFALLFFKIAFGGGWLCGPDGAGTAGGPWAAVRSRVGATRGATTGPHCPKGQPRYRRQPE